MRNRTFLFVATRIDFSHGEQRGQQCDDNFTLNTNYFSAATTPSGVSKLPEKVAIGEPPAG